MTEDFRTRFDPTRRPGDPGAGAAPVEGEEADGLPGPPTEAYSLVSADRRQKMMVVFRFKTGNAVALAYGYLVSVEYDPSLAIQMDFSGYQVQILGRNLGPLFAGLVAQRVAAVREMDDLTAEAFLPPTATVVTQISVRGPQQP